MSACARNGCIHHGVVAVPVGHGRTAGWVRLCEPDFEAWLAGLKTRSKYPCAIADCLDFEHVDGLCERHWVTLRGADPANTPAASTTLKRFAVRHRRATGIVADAPALEDPHKAGKQARTLDELARSVGRLVRGVVPEVLADVHEAATLLQAAATRARALGAVVVRGTKPVPLVASPGPVQAVRGGEQKRKPTPARSKAKPAASGAPQPGLFDALFNRTGATGRST